MFRADESKQMTTGQNCRLMIRTTKCGDFDMEIGEEGLAVIEQANHFRLT